MNTIPPNPEEVLHVEKIDIGTFYIYPKKVLGIINDGVNLKLDQFSVLIALCEKHYGLNDFAYISYRINSYAVDPTLYTYLLEMDHLKGICIVTDNDIYIQNFKIEKAFYSKNMKIFNDLNQAFEWADTIVD